MRVYYGSSVPRMERWVPGTTVPALETTDTEYDVDYEEYE